MGQDSTMVGELAVDRCFCRFFYALVDVLDGVERSCEMRKDGFDSVIGSGFGSSLFW